MNRIAKGKNRACWLRIDAETNAIDYLSKAYSFVQQAERDKLAWKWIVLSLHSALYGFAICACKGSNPDNIKQRRDGKLTEKLITIGEALKRCKDPTWMRPGKNIHLTDEQQKSVNRLTYTFRNNFEHLIFDGWSIDLVTMEVVKMATNVLDVIRFLALETDHYSHLTETQKRKIKSIVFQSKKRLTHHRLYKSLK